MKIRGFVAAGCVFIAAGIAAVAVAYSRGDLNKYKAEDIVIETKTYDGTAIKSISIDVDYDNVTLIGEDRTDISIDTKTLDDITYTIKLEGDKLTIDQTQTKWYDQIFTFNFPGAKRNVFTEKDLVIKVPNTIAYNYAITVNAGKLVGECLLADNFVSITNAGSSGFKDVTAENAEISINAGSLNLTKPTINNKLKVKVNAGSAKIEEAVVKEFDTKVNAGKLNINSMNVEDITIDTSAGTVIFKGIVSHRGNIHTSAGTVEMNFQDARDNYTVDGSGTGSVIITSDSDAGSVKYTFGN